MYRALRRRQGSLNSWWPAESCYEVFVGAILTQQTQWKNVDKAIENLKTANMMSPDALARARISDIQKWVRPAGFYVQKSNRLKSITQSILDEFGSFESLAMLGDEELRAKLLSYNGIGNETADSIMLYVFRRKSFVVDAYTKRILGRLTGISPGSYDDVQRYFTAGLKRNLLIYMEFHAQLVELAKRNCRTDPLCFSCPLRSMCAHARRT